MLTDKVEIWLFLDLACASGQLGDNVPAEILRFNTAELHAVKKSSRFRHTIDF
jgi:hypothetical protein